MQAGEVDSAPHVLTRRTLGEHASRSVAGVSNIEQSLKLGAKRGQVMPNVVQIGKQRVYSPYRQPQYTEASAMNKTAPTSHTINKMNTRHNARWTPRNFDNSPRDNNHAYAHPPPGSPLWRQILRSMYQRYAPHKISELDNILWKYHNYGKQLHDSLINTYEGSPKAADYSHATGPIQLGRRQCRICRGWRHFANECFKRHTIVDAYVV